MTTKTLRRLHVGLFVSRLDVAVEFYRRLLGTEPSKNYSDYVEFVVDNPPIVIVLSPQPHAPGGTLNHVGMRLPHAAALAAMHQRLQDAGFALQTQDKVACCYAQQSKIWVTDPDHNLWEIYVLEKHLDRHGFEDPERPTVTTADAETSWEYRLPEPFPASIDHPDGAVDEVRLCGAFNADVSRETLDRLLSETRRVLKPGGRVIAQGLVGDRPFPGKPDLPGLAAKIQRVPVESEPLQTLARAGFVNLHYEELADIHCFRVEGVELRKLKLCGHSPRVAAIESSDVSRDVLYKGPLDRVTDDAGRVFVRGERTAVDDDTWELLRRGPVAKQFVFFQTTPELEGTRDPVEPRAANAT